MLALIAHSLLAFRSSCDLTFLCLHFILFCFLGQDPSAKDVVYDLVVIGAGAGGLVTSAGAAGVGAKVALIEEHMLGGDWYVVHKQ